MRVIVLATFIATSVACGGAATLTQPSRVTAADAGASSQPTVLSTLGRNKVGPSGTCVFDPADSGPDQCTVAGSSSTTTPVSGRNKIGSFGTCVFVPGDTGPDQCTLPGSVPATSIGRYKIGSLGTCIFVAESGPDQCTPF